MIRHTLSPLIKLTELALVGVPIGDDGFRQLVEHRALPSTVILNNVEITPVSLPVLAAYLDTLPPAAEPSEVLLKRSLCSSTGQDITDIMESASTSWELVEREVYSTPVYTSTFQITGYLCFECGQGRELVVLF